LLWLLAAKKKKLLLLLQHQSLKPHQLLLLQPLQPLTLLPLRRWLLRPLLTLLLLLRPLLPLLLRPLRLLHRLLPLPPSNSLELKSRPAGRLFYAWWFDTGTADVKKPALGRFFFIGADHLTCFGELA
jgi:hypothetical protein